MAGTECLFLGLRSDVSGCEMLVVAFDVEVLLTDFLAISTKKPLISFDNVVREGSRPGRYVRFLR